MNHEFDLKEINQQWCRFLITSFYSKKFWIMRDLSSYFESTLNYPITWDQRHYIKFYPVCLSVRKMTLYGFLVSTIPNILKYLENTDEFDLDRRLKIYKLLLVTKKVEIRKAALSRRERYEFTKAKKEANAQMISHKMVKDQRMLNSDWKLVK